jgi:hypothetical protein
MHLALTVALAIGMPVAAFAQTAAPDLVGTWTGPFKTVIFGHNPHHPGEQTVDSPPRVREINFTLAVEGQDGAVLWGRSWSDPARKEPFAATLTPDGSIVGSDTDGSLHIKLTAPDRMELCYTHTGLGPSGSIVASCGVLDRQN